MKNKKNGIIDNLALAVAAACGPLGVKIEHVQLTPTGVVVPSLGVSVSAELVNNKRVWSATETFAVASLDGDDERMQVRTLFQEPLDKQWQLARRLALLAATRKIDAAIDEAIS
ncbi:hypothetical protein [Rhizobium leguminosarum]|jgi:hypothetical protein|uniref:hypothetical protein n=1 Tax=Rhizobium leguminosarum TaxID=384 RepID=UPI002E12DD24|nr:hypothetical protein U8Q02_37110 [Rhizobium leguminosarum]